MVRLVAVSVRDAESSADGRLVTLLRDKHGFTLRPLENGVDGWHDRDEVSLRIAWQLAAAPRGGELEFPLANDRAIKDAARGQRYHGT